MASPRIDARGMLLDIPADVLAVLADPEARRRADAGLVPCQSTPTGPGCGHPTSIHFGSDAVAGCACCSGESWRGPGGLR